MELGIYIHIPFCKKKCNYCDFISYSNKTNYKQYFQALKTELSSYKLEKYNVTTIYIGGGTPSYVDSCYIYEIMQELKTKLKKNKTKFEDIEITIEINPGTITCEKVKKYKEIGINRVSIGLQTANDILLKQIGRIHSYKDFLDTYKLLKINDFENINIDLMIGLPNQTITDIKETLEKVVKLETKHISVYSLIVEEGTKIEKQLSEGTLQLPSEELERQMYWYVKNKLENYGYNQYEISNFSKIGFESKHNLNCWNQKEYIGLGLAAHSYVNGIRYSNTLDIEKYTSILENNHELKEIRNIEEIQNIEDKKKEFMLLGLRKLEGVNISEFKLKYLENPIYLFKNEINKLSKEGLVCVDGNYIKLTNKGLDFANIVFEEFV